MMYRIFNLAFIFATAVFSYNTISVSAQSNCNDSTSFFEYQGTRRQCNWVANKNRSACDVPFVKSFCPKTCQACQSYACRDVDVPFYVGANKQQMQCSDLNNLSDFKKNFKCRQNKYRKNCRATCRVCAGQTDPISRPPTPTTPTPPTPTTPTNPTPTNLWVCAGQTDPISRPPTPSNPTPPTPTTPTNPTPTTPTNPRYCEDSTSFVILEGQKRQCNWISKNKRFCNLQYVKELCPDTCDACQFGCNDVSSPFYIGANKSEAQMCSIIALLPAQKRNFKCQLAKFRKNCRDTCRVCAGQTGPISRPPTPSNPTPSTPTTPTNPPPTNQYCEDSKSFIEVKGVKRQCNYIGNKSRGSCNLDFVKRFCPKTCNACQLGCEDVNVPFFIGGNKAGQVCRDLNELTDNAKQFKCGQNKYRQNCRRTCGVCA
eukprot:CAMPEP_0204652052 /NCGR_PEP_ID=MMETSP0718-20130828/14331_1 /ASSEMBLY_ACC=CAM_ASM_000674 /TAXON_ID=230516 /ORGANISM="Chaetoceros curvisetus" /LENGTH=427 /DNA_ID=CAMNT_0051675963 /DNA_START=13 /DNA_END=1297 /DNA_ORIENTATION=-